MDDVNKTAWTDKTLPTGPIKFIVDGKPITIHKYNRHGMPHMYYCWLAWVEPELRDDVYRDLDFGFSGYVLWNYIMNNGPAPDKNNPNHIRRGLRA